MSPSIQRFLVAIAAISPLCAAVDTSHAADKLRFEKGDHICYIGNTLADRMQHHAWLETYLHALHPEHELTFRNLGFAGDEITTRPRSQNFGSPDQWLTKCEADVVFCFFGYNEALRGDAALAGFESDLASMIDQMSAQKYNGRSAPRLVVFSPIAHENLNIRHLPDGSANNKNLEMYTAAMAKVCESKGVLFVDIFHPTRQLYASAKQPLTMNGIHLLDRGNKALAEVIIGQLFPDASLDNIDDVTKLRQAVQDKNYHWFSRYRTVDGYNVYGGRSKLAWFGQSNADVMKREMEIFDVMTANRDRGIWSVARGRDYKVLDDNLPSLVEVKTNKPGPKDGKYSYLGGEEAISKMRIAEGMQCNLFASEEMFPRLINPVQMSVDTDSRLWASVWPSYPHWNPTQPREDALVILPDEDRDGIADECIVFADKLNSVTGFEFWGGGVLVASPPEIWFLKDTDGDDKADYKLRVLQGVSSADSHHTANAMVIGTDGCLYWSRGVFHVTNMETPTKTFRSTQTGVYRFDPRTFEISFHFPIGPNPHGDVIDRWGYQFVNDGTSGTGSYVNIGKGIGNKKWFEKRVRPVPATGILSSSHFPDANNGNFLICNAIGVLGVLQHEVKYNGADITAVEIEPIVVSSDPNFRPSDLEVGGDGALYVADWQNALIGHMQHNIRDPNRDHLHGRIYRFTYQGRPLVKPAKMKGKPIEVVCENFFARENGTRYRAKIELSGRETSEVVAKVGRFAAGLDPAKAAIERDEAQALLECLWVFEEHRVPNIDLLKKVFLAEEPRVRAAAIRTLGHWAGQVQEWQSTLVAAARDESALVRAEAVKAAVEFPGLTSAEVIFEVATRPLDPELDTVLKYAKSQINVDQVVRDALHSGQKLSPAAMAYVYRNASAADLLKMEPSEAVYRAVLARDNATPSQLATALAGLARISKAQKLELLLNLIEQADNQDADGNLAGLGQLLAQQSADELRSALGQIRKLATGGRNEATRRYGVASWIAAEGSVDDAFISASKSKEGLRDFLEAIALIPNADVRATVFTKVQPLLFELPAELQTETVGDSSLQQPGIQVDYFSPNPSNVAAETLARLTPKASGVVPEIKMNVPQLLSRDGFALRFTGAIQIDRGGQYTFFTSSDDGSRLYIGDQLVVNNDGLHGMREKGGTIDLTSGSHPIVVTYFDNGGGDGLTVSYSGPQIKKQQIPPERLSLSGGENLHDAAVRALASIPGHETDKFRSLARLLKQNRNQASAIAAIAEIPTTDWPQNQVRPLADNLVAYLSNLPARYRTTPAAVGAVALARTAARKLPAGQAADIEQRLQNLDVRVIAIGTVPHRMIYDKEKIVVQAGKPVEFRFSNADSMPHNFSVILPGSLEEVGLLGEATGRDADAMERHYIPESDKILVSSKLLQPGESQAIAFEVPTTPGVYPYVCTYPGHWRRMYGALYVVEDYEEYQANPVDYLAANPMPLKDQLLTYLSRGREWKYDELVSDIEHLYHGRAFEVGKQLFRVANCVGCHKLNDEGQQIGQDLTKWDPKQKPADLLRSMVEPSNKIDEKFQSYVFILTDGKIVSGMILEQNDDEVKIIENPLAKATPLVLKKSEIDEQEKSPKSIMPEGLLNKLTREEILDLLAYVYARGDKKNKIYESHAEHNH